jgi:signal transduction histidine kinase
MNTLDACQIAVATAGGEPSARRRIDALRRAGASVRFCALSQELWSALSDASFDAIVVLLEPEDAASLAIYAQLHADARTRGIPTLLVTALRDGAHERGVLLLSADVDDDGFVDALSELATPMRRLREAEQQERVLREQVRAELTLSERAVRELGDLSHELRSMLAPVVDFACNLRDELAGPLSSDQRAHVAGILSAVERATRLLEKHRSGSLAAMRRVSLAPASAPPRAQRTLVHLARVASEVTASFGALASRKGLRVICSSDDTVCVWGDALKLKQVVTNLVVNAIKYTQKGGEVVVRVAWSRPSVAGGVEARRAAEVVVSDNGPGIAPEHREQIFLRGFRIDRKTDVAGEGIGLAVVKELVKQHGGSVAVEGEPGSGAVFRVSLPQDRRQRARTGALVLREGDAARAMLSLLVSNEAVTALASAEDKQRFLQLAAACRAAIVLTSDEELDAALSLAPATSSGDGGYAE